MIIQIMHPDANHMSSTVHSYASSSEAAQACFDPNAELNDVGR